MDALQRCAEKYERLTNFEYKIIIARKGKAHELYIRFNIVQFHHLAGIHKLNDLRIARQNRKKVFDKIRSGEITDSSLQESRYYTVIKQRLELLNNLEEILDSNELVFRYHKKSGDLSMIDADYLLSTFFKNKECYVFLTREEKCCFCRSFFPKTNRDYTKGQVRYTMLYKEKRNLVTGEVTIQYNRL